jgi:hypothetical protein
MVAFKSVMPSDDVIRPVKLSFESFGCGRKKKPTWFSVWIRGMTIQRINEYKKIAINTLDERYMVMICSPLLTKTTSAGRLAKIPTMTTPVILLIVSSSLLGSIMSK